MTTATVPRSDPDIRRDVLDELRWDARVQPNAIDVAVEDGVVTLAGWVDSYIKKWTAERAAQRVKGVRAVANEVDVRLPGSSVRADADLAAAATRALAWDALVPAGQLEVTATQ